MESDAVQGAGTLVQRCSVPCFLLQALVYGPELRSVESNDRGDSTLPHAQPRSPRTPEGLVLFASGHVTLMACSVEHVILTEHMRGRALRSCAASQQHHEVFSVGNEAAGHGDSEPASLMAVTCRRTFALADPPSLTSGTSGIPVRSCGSLWSRLAGLGGYL